MGFESEFNWFIVDKREPKELVDLEVGGNYSFDKKGYRQYPINIPLFLLDRDWNVLGFAKVTYSKLGNNVTVVNYQVTKLFTSDERSFLTRIIKESRN